MTIKKLNRIAVSFSSFTISIIITLLLTATACSDPSEKSLTEAERVTQLLTAGTWSLSSIMVDDQDVADLFLDFSITFTETSYTTTGTTPVWSRDGLWSFVSTNSPTQFTREDDVEVTIAAIEENMLQLELTWSKETISGGRSASISGSHVFILIR